MRKILLVAGAAVAALSMPALGQGQGRGQGNGPPLGLPPVTTPPVAVPPVTPPVSTHADDHASGQVQTDVRAQTDSRASTRAQVRTGANVDRSTDTDDTSVNVSNNARVTADVNGDTETRRGQPNYGGNTCPPGLAGRDPACVPPGQADRTFRQGQRLPDNYRYFTDLANIDISTTLRNSISTQYPSNAYRYVFNGDSIYVVSRTNNTVTAVIDATP
jgi:hypothetical protein